MLSNLRTIGARCFVYLCLVWKFLPQFDLNKILTILMNLRSFLVRNIATIHTMTRVRIKDLLIAENYASAAILSNQSKRNELNVFTFTWFPFYLKPYKDFVWRICIDPSQWLWGEGLKLKVLIPMFSQNNFHLRWYTLTTIIPSIFYRLEAEGGWEVRILGIT